MPEGDELTLVDGVETIAESPSSRSASRVNRVTQSTGTTAATNPGEAMLTDEILRARMFGFVITAFSLVTLAIVLVLGGNPTARLVFIGFLIGYALVASGYTLALYREPSVYNQRVLSLIALLALPTAYSGVYYWGFFSPAAIVTVMALYFNSLVGSFLYTLVIYVAFAAGQALIAGLIIGGVLPDVGLIQASAASVESEVLTQVVVQGVLLATFVMARLSRRATRLTIAELDEAVRVSSQREALLREARAELERANRAGDVGRFTDQEFGSYRLGVILGRGAMGEVYAATHVETHERAAVKLLKRNVLSEPDIVARFAREARAASAIESDNVARVLEVGSEPLPYIAMELLEGADLGQILRTGPIRSLRAVADMVAQLAEGIGAAHAKGIVHRDIKPRNIFRSSDGDRPVWKLLDFGVSKLADSSGTVTQGKVVGTPAYMAPEQARGEEVDRGADIYALGAVAYRVLTDQPPFQGKDTPATLYSVVYDQAPPPLTLRSELGAEVDAVIAKAMSKRTDDRYGSAEDFADALREALC